MKDIKLVQTDIKAHCRNKREEFLVRVYNGRIREYAEDIRDNTGIGKKLKDYDGMNHWTIEQCIGMLASMYHMDMLDNPYSGAWRSVLEEYTEITGEVLPVYKFYFKKEDVA